jgi:hypothetical protein
MDARHSARTRGAEPRASEPLRPAEASGVRRIPAALPRPGTTAAALRLAKLPYARREIVPQVDESAHVLSPLPALSPSFGSLPSFAPQGSTGSQEESDPRHHAPTLPTPPRGTDGLAGPLDPRFDPAFDPGLEATFAPPRDPPRDPPRQPAAHPPVDLARTESAQLPEVDLDLASSRLRTRGTPRPPAVADEQIRTLVYAPEPSRLAWIERELSHAPITIQLGRRARTIVAALVRDPPPRPDVLVVDFDAVSPAEIAELQALRREGWRGRLIGLGHVTFEQRNALGVDHVFEPPLVRDSLLDCVAGTKHAAVTTACPIIPPSDDNPWDDNS